MHIVGTSRLLKELGTKEMFDMVNKIFCKFDELTQTYQLEKIKTIGSSYMVAGNLPETLPNHVIHMVELALEMLKYIQQFSKETGYQFNLRVGLNVGNCVGGVIGSKKFVTVISSTNPCRAMMCGEMWLTLQVEWNLQAYLDSYKHTKQLDR